TAKFDLEKALEDKSKPEKITVAKAKAAVVNWMCDFIGAAAEADEGTEDSPRTAAAVTAALIGLTAGVGIATALSDKGKRNEFIANIIEGIEAETDRYQRVWDLARVLGSMAEKKMPVDEIISKIKKA